eukprot:scaffold13313_cov314-Alexandrium_tamarense.AAC.3
MLYADGGGENNAYVGVATNIVTLGDAGVVMMCCEATEWQNTSVVLAADPRYNGHPLPSRYQDLTLPSDWWIPGKGDRRKRLHRKLSRHCAASIVSYQADVDGRGVNANVTN